MTYLVDSDWVIDGIASIPSAMRVLEQRAPDGLAVSILTVGEVFEGAYGFPNADEHLAGFRTFLSGYTIIGLDEETVEIFARTRYQLRRQGNLIPDMDLLVAATALRHNLTLMTRNVRHFSRIPGLRLFR